MDVAPISRPRVLLSAVSSDEERPRAGGGSARSSESVPASVMSVWLRRSSRADSEGSTGSSRCNVLRRCSKRAVED